jgi:hypothetical protein
MATKEESATPRFSGPAFQIGVFLVALLILFLRRPDALLNAQFYAEDGARWFADAYHVGWRCLLIPDSGYLQTVSRLIGLLCQLVPFSFVPLAMNLFAFFFQILPVNIFLSQRFTEVPFKIRLASSLLYLSIPNSFETHANTTNIQWHLALACCLLLLSQSNFKSPFRYFEWLLLALSVLDGPAGILLLPVAAILWWLRRDKQSLVALTILVPGCALQTLVLVLSHSRRPASNGATLTRFIEIVGGQVFLSSILGLRTSIHLFFAHVEWLVLAQGIALVIGLAIVGYALWRGPLPLKLFIFYSYLSLALAMIHPVASFGAEYPQWQLLLTPGVANRYYLFPMLAFFAALIWIAANAAPGEKFARYAAIVVLALLPIGIVRDWRYKPFVDYHFKSFAADFDRAAPGTTVSIPINPNWQLVLIKH